MGRVIVILVLIGCSISALFWMRRVQPAPAAPSVVANAPAPISNHDLKADPIPLIEKGSSELAAGAVQHVEFSSSEMTDKMVLEVGRMVRPNRVMAGIETLKSGRVAFVIVEGEGRLYDMEPDLLGQYEPVMKDLGLSPATGISTRVLSRYRSVSKTAMAFDEQKDRMIVIVMPSLDWPTMRLPKPVLSLTSKTEN